MSIRIAFCLTIAAIGCRAVLGQPIGEQIRGRRLEIGSELPLGDRPTTHYVIHVIRSAEEFERVQDLYR